MTPREILNELKWREDRDIELTIAFYEAFDVTYNVTVASDVEGELLRLTTDDDLNLTLEDLEVGWHNITVTVSDGEQESTDQVQVRVRRVADNDVGAGVIIVNAVLILVAVLLGLWFLMRRPPGTLQP